MLVANLTKILTPRGYKTALKLLSTPTWSNFESKGLSPANFAVQSQQLRCLSLTANLFSERRYHDKHEWVTIKDNIATVGISNYAQKLLGDIVFVELPEVNREVEKDDEVGCVESTKSANDIYSPISGKIVEVNEKLESEPHLLNSSPYDEGWIYKMEIPNEEEFSRLMDEDHYEKFVRIQDGDSAH